jgi:hypothetical protein
MQGLKNPTTEETFETFRLDPLITWVATVALVLILIVVALSLAAWRQHRQNPSVLALASVSIPESRLNPRSGSACSGSGAAKPSIVAPFEEKAD